MVFDYKANTNAYALNCENKARPQMHCNGQCQLMKKLKKEEKKDQENPDRKSENKQEVLLSSKSFFPFIQIYTVVENKPLYPLYNTGHATDMPRSILRPPIA